MAGLLDVVPGPAFVPDDPDPALLPEVRKALGSVPPCMRYLTPVPWVLRFAIDTMKPPVFAIRPEVAELGAWATAHENACRYCYGARRALLRVTGKSDAWIARVERDAELAELDPAQRAMLELARKLARSNPRPARAERDQLASAQGGDAAVDMAYVVAANCFINRVATFLRLPPDAGFERIAASRLVPFMRPLFRWLVRRPAPRPAPVSLAGPFRDVLEGMGALPGAFAMRRTIDDAFASPILPRRAKLLVFAVVARSIPCAPCEAEAVRLLAAEGLAEAETAEVLTSLGSPRLDAREALLVAFARASVRYQFAEIQDHVEKHLVAALSRAELIEAVGIAALANAVVRLAMLSA